MSRQWAAGHSKHLLCTTAAASILVLCNEWFLFFREQLLQELRSSNNPSSRLFNELRKIMEEIKNLDGETIDVLASGEGTHITPG